MTMRPGIIDDAARARAVTLRSPPFTARDRSGYPTAGRLIKARVPARQSARRPITRTLSGERNEVERAHRRVYPARGVRLQPSLEV